MSGLAKITYNLGVKVTGSELEESETTYSLRESGIEVWIGHSFSFNPVPDLVIFSSAIHDENLELVKAKELKLKSIRRGNFLAEIAKFYPKRVAISGSHGKTTIAAMLTWILTKAKRDPGYLIGGKIREGQLSTSSPGKGEIFITEVDESDGSQSKMSSTHAIIANMDDDHFWNHHGIENLQKNFLEFGLASEYLLCLESSKLKKQFRNHPNCEFLAKDSLIRDEISINIMGKHNRFNALFALHMAQKLGVSRQFALEYLSEFPGIERRMTKRFHRYDIIILEDYAHHPTEIRVTLECLRENYPHQRQVLVFQPHRIERVLNYSTKFAKELSKADLLFVTPPFTAWKKSLHKVDSTRIVEQIEGPPVIHFGNAPFRVLADQISQRVERGDILVIMGAGDIEKVIPILIDGLNNKFSKRKQLQVNA